MNQKNFDNIPLYLRVSDLTSTPQRKGLLPISSTTLWRWVKSGDFPQSVKLGPSVTAWSSESVQAWLNQASEVKNVQH